MKSYSSLGHRPTTLDDGGKLPNLSHHHHHPRSLSASPLERFKRSKLHSQHRSTRSATPNQTGRTNNSNKNGGAVHHPQQQQQQHQQQQQQRIQTGVSRLHRELSLETLNEKLSFLTTGPGHQQARVPTSSKLDSRSSSSSSGTRIADAGALNNVENHAMMMTTLGGSGRSSAQPPSSSSSSKRSFTSNQTTRSHTSSDSRRTPSNNSGSGALPPSERGTYLTEIQEAVNKHGHSSSMQSKYAGLPKSMIPEEYYVYSQSPVAPQSSSSSSSSSVLSTNGEQQQQDDDMNVSFDATKNEWKRLMFPSYAPSARSEVYLLAKTMDAMMAKMNEEEVKVSDEKSYNDLTLSRLARSFRIHIIGLFEISRQVYVTCAERGILLQKIYEYFCEFFETSISTVRHERQKCDDFQNIINEYDVLLKEMVAEKEKTRQEMEELMRENNSLFREKEELRQRVENTAKYDLVLKILKNKQTWESFLKQTNNESTKQDLSLASITTSDDIEEEQQARNRSKRPRKIVQLNAVSTNIARSSRYDEIEGVLTEQKREKLKRASPTNSNFLTTPTMARPKSQEDAHTQRMLKLIWTNMNETFTAVNNISKNASQVLDKPLVTEMDNERFVASIPDLQTLLAGIYEINARLNEVNAIYRDEAQKIEREKLMPKPIIVRLVPNNRLNTIQVILKSNVVAPR